MGSRKLKKKVTTPTLIEKHVGLVSAVYHKLVASGDLKKHAIQFKDELISAGYEALCIAPQDWRGEGKFKTYAGIIIASAMIDEINELMKWYPVDFELWETDIVDPVDPDLTIDIMKRAGLNKGEIYMVMLTVSHSDYKIGEAARILDIHRSSASRYRKSGLEKLKRHYTGGVGGLTF